ncbi:hypothetical protein [Mesorhizobium sp.]|uniref:hypothetical protein n=1 Tax=Mesorhizobium sp. TaxID=1871066 RepID=UPI0011F43C32|nr:hypothetical protein [Mesorhizobium sp.]TIL46135.1 MAG: hypothetical protein E5Y86_08520 [Mesorhizobium sp.]
MRRAILLFVSCLFFTPWLNSASAEEKWPSIIYYGEKTNERIDGPLFWEGQAGLLAQQRLVEKSHGAATGYGAISKVTGNPRTTRVSGYTKANGTRVAPYYRSRR